MKQPLYLTAQQRRLNRVFTQAAIQRILNDPKLRMTAATINAQRAAAMRSPNAWKALEAKHHAKTSMLVNSSAEAVKLKLRATWGEFAKGLHYYKQAEQAQEWDGSDGVLAMFPNGI